MWSRWATALLEDSCAVDAVTLIARESYQSIELAFRCDSTGRHGDLEVRFVAPSKRHDLEGRVDAVVAILTAIDASRVTKLAVTPSRRFDPALQTKIDAATRRYQRSTTG